MAGDSPASILFDELGHPIGVYFDGYVYRVEVDSRLTDGYGSFVGVTNVAPGVNALKVDVVKTVSGGGVGIGGTSSNFMAPFPMAGTAVGFTDGYYMQGAEVFNLQTGGGQQWVLGTNLRTEGVGGSVDFGTLTHPIATELADGYGNLISAVNPLSVDVTDRAGRDIGLINRSSIANITIVPAAISDTPLLAANPLRRGVLIYNSSMSPLRISFGNTAASLSSFSDYILAQSQWEMPLSVIFLGQFRGIWGSTDGYAFITELT